jgi:hypothetical protein
VTARKKRARSNKKPKQSLKLLLKEMQAHVKEMKKLRNQRDYQYAMVETVQLVLIACIQETTQENLREHHLLQLDITIQLRNQTPQLILLLM